MNRLLVVLAVLVMALPASAAPTCEATVHGELTRVEPKETVTTHTFAVNVTTLESCAEVHFTLTTTERISKKKVNVVKTNGQVRLRNGSASQILHFDMTKGHKLEKWDVKVTGCTRCES